MSQLQGAKDGEHRPDGSWCNHPPAHNMQQRSTSTKQSIGCTLNPKLLGFGETVAGNVISQKISAREQKHDAIYPQGWRAIMHHAVTVQQSCPVPRSLSDHHIVQGQYWGRECLSHCSVATFRPSGINSHASADSFWCGGVGWVGWGRNHTVETSEKRLCGSELPITQLKRESSAAGYAHITSRHPSCVLGFVGRVPWTEDTVL